MNLIPFSKDYLRLNEALPFGLRDGSGRLLLAAGERIERADRLDLLRDGELFADESESAAWRRRLTGAVDKLLRQNASLQQIAEVQPEREAPRKPAAPLRFTELWSELALALDACLREPRADTAWLNQLLKVAERIGQLGDKRLDASLYHLIFTAGHTTEYYSSHHAMLCALIARETARMLDWDGETVASLVRAALTMNISMRRLQDVLAARNLVVTPTMRSEIDAHAARSAQLLAAAGVADRLWLAIVQLHHDDSHETEPLADLVPQQRAARLLRRVDLFAAKLSRRAVRHPMSPVQAAREACLGADGLPDEIGAALLKSVGLYPPGSFVELANGEVGIVLARGRRANLPLVAALVGAGGAPLGVPALRDTLDKRYAVKGAVKTSQVKVIPPHEALLTLR